ncbi:Mo-dependent nitrogenase C-terminal domain-containing protein [Synechocystis sp. LKSZ1]|uniref:Mo-dependent nitrogenase C-terminal domain-containing protein n=1 Tax=Synechocystis sp. LKSZ1 TaxID=3144951 RepID=UPI00336BF71D
MDSFTEHLHSHPISAPGPASGLEILRPLRDWIDRLDVNNRFFAHQVCRIIPCCCPFERTFSLMGREIHIPALCELNPVYNELVGLRFRSLSYLADVCGEDISHYIC